MDKIADKSVDMILCDLPYGTTACKWDSVIPFELLWKNYKRIIKDNSAIVLTASQPFTSALIMSNPKMFRYSWIWEKSMAGNFLNVKRQPFKKHEDVLVFSKLQTKYFPQMLLGVSYSDNRTHKKEENRSEIHGGGKLNGIIGYKNKTTRYPKSVIQFSNPNNNSLHPTQKPVSLMEYLIKTYTNEGETVLDNCMGSGSTGVACQNTNRHFIGIEQDKKYFDIAVKRVSEYCG